MKAFFKPVSVILLAACLSGCVSTDTVVTAPDGTTTHTFVRGIDPNSVATAAAIATALAPLAIHADK